MFSDINLRDAIRYSEDGPVLVATLRAIVTPSVFVAFGLDVADEAFRRGSTAIVEDMTRCMIVATDDDVESLEYYGATFSSRLPIACVLPPEAMEIGQRYVLAMSMLGRSRSIFTDLPAAASWAQAQARIAVRPAGFCARPLQAGTSRPGPAEAERTGSQSQSEPSDPVA